MQLGPNMKRLRELDVGDSVKACVIAGPAGPIGVGGQRFHGIRWRDRRCRRARVRPRGRCSIRNGNPDQERLDAQRLCEPGIRIDRRWPGAEVDGWRLISEAY